MTTKQLQTKIERVRRAIKIGNRRGFKGNNESELHFNLEVLERCLTQLERIEHQLNNLKSI